MDDDQDASGRQLVRDHREQRPPEESDANDKIPRTWRKGIRFEVNSQGPQPQPLELGIPLGQRETYRGDVGQCHIQPPPGQPEGIGPGATRDVERPAAAWQHSLDRDKKG